MKTLKKLAVAAALSPGEREVVIRFLESMSATSEDEWIGADLDDSAS